MWVKEMIAGRLPRPWQLSALARGSPLWVRGHPAVAPPPTHSPPDTADVVGPPWRGPDHIWLWLQPDNPALSAPSTSLSSATLILPEVMCDTFSTHQYRFYRVIYTIFKTPKLGHVLSKFYFSLNTNSWTNIWYMKHLIATVNYTFLPAQEAFIFSCPFFPLTFLFRISDKSLLVKQNKWLLT